MACLQTGTSARSLLTWGEKDGAKGRALVTVGLLPLTAGKREPLPEGHETGMCSRHSHLYLLGHLPWPRPLGRRDRELGRGAKPWGADVAPEGGV